VKGWSGDQGLTYRENGKVCFASDTALKDSASADAFEGAGKAWAATMPSVSVVRFSPTVVDFRSCDPGAAYNHPMPQPSAFKTLSVRSEFIAGLQKSGLKHAVAACVTDAVIANVGAGPFAAIGDVTDENDPSLAPIQRAARQVIGTCQRTTRT
jgi:hypothetical protein